MLGKSKDIHCRRRLILKILVRSRKSNIMPQGCWMDESAGYCRAVDVGGWDASHHSADLRYLVKRGFAEIKKPSFGNKFYRATDEGTALVDNDATAQESE